MTSHIAGTIETEGKTLWQLISERALVTPDKRMALDERGRTMTYGEYKNWCERVAAGLSQKGITENTNVSWVLPSKFESLVLTGALSRLGAIENRTHACHDAATNESGRRERNIFRNLHALNITHESFLSERTGGCKVVNRIAVQSEWLAPVAKSCSASGGSTVHAVLTKSAGSERGDDDVVAGLNMGHGIANFGNDSGSLVATHARRGNGVHAAHVRNVAMA